jgi:ubiquinone/menaquinone biosynthesis C-methylase UbiE
MFHHSHAAPAPETQGRIIRWAWRYDLVVNILSLGRAGVIREMTARLAHIQAGDSVLDVGCGTGDLTLAAKRLAGVGGRVCGVDAAPEMIGVAQYKAARANSSVDFRVGVIESLPFPDASFDVALSSLMMHHLPDDVKRQGLREVRRVLKPGGRLLIVDMKRMTGVAGHLSPMLMAHAGMRDGVQDLPELLRQVGFADVESGDTRFAPLGYAAGRTLSTL